MNTPSLMGQRVFCVSLQKQVTVVGRVDWASSEFADPSLELVVTGHYTGHDCKGMRDHIEWVEGHDTLSPRAHYWYVTASDLTALSSGEVAAEAEEAPLPTLGSYVRMQDEEHARLRMVVALNHENPSLCVVYGAGLGHGARLTPGEYTWLEGHDPDERPLRFQSEGYWYSNLLRLIHVPHPTVEELQDLVF